MPQIKFDEVLIQLESGLKQLAKTTLSDYLQESKTDGLNMLDGLKADLQIWTTLLTNGEISKRNFTYLINSKKDLIEMGVLKQKGIAAIRLDQFKASAVKLITSTIIGLI